MLVLTVLLGEAVEIGKAVRYSAASAPKYVRFILAVFVEVDKKFGHLLIKAVEVANQAVQPVQTVNTSN